MMRKFVRCSAASSLIILFFSVAVLFCSTAVPGTAWAHSSGMSGYSGNPATNSGATCTDCHSGGATPTVTLTGPTSLTSGTSGVYTLTITGGAAVDGGLDVSTTAGTLQATGANTKLMNGEVTHTSAIAFTGSSLSFTFTLVAPSTAGSLTLYGAGLSANGSGSSGDYPNTATLAVSVTAPSAPHIVVTDSVAPINDLQIPFGSVTDGLTSDQTVTVINSGNANLVIGMIANANPLVTPFSITSDNCSGKTIAAAGTCAINIRFAPTSAGSFNDSFDIPSNDPSTPTSTVSVSGTGTTAPVPVIAVTDSVAPNNDLSIPFGFAAAGNTSDQTVTVTNNGNANLVIGKIANSNPLAAPFSIMTDNCSNQTIAPAGTCTAIVRFAPASSASFSDSFDIPSNDPSTPTITMNVSGTSVNNPPTAPSLVSPTDGQTGVGTTATLVWNKSTDPDNDPITYHVYNCPGDPSASCTPLVASNGMAGIYFAGSGLLFVGFVFTGKGRGRKMMLMLMIAMLLVSGAVFISCGSGGGGSSSPAGMSHQVSGLNSATTYYWKVVADDGRGGLATSPTWSFTTQ